MKKLFQMKAILLFFLLSCIAGDFSKAQMIQFSMWRSPKCVNGTPTLVQHVAVDTGIASSWPISLSQATGAGNLIVVSYTTSSDFITGITDNKGNTYVSTTEDNNGQASIGIWYAKNSIAGATTVTLNFGTNSDNGPTWIEEFSGMDKYAPFDTGNTMTNGTASTTLTGPTVTTSMAKDVLVSVVGQGSTVSAGMHAGNPFTQLTVSSFGDDSAYYLPTSTGTYGAVWNANASTAWDSSIAAFKPSSCVTSPSFVQASSMSTSGTSPSGAATGSPFALNVTSGNHVSLSVAADTTGFAITSISGCAGVTWTLLDHTNGPNFGQMWTYDGHATSTAACTPTVNYTVGTFTAVAINANEIENTTGVDVHGIDASDHTIASTTVTAKSVTTTGANRFISCSIGNTSDAYNQLMVQGAGNTIQGNAYSSMIGAMEYQTVNQASAGATSNTFVAPGTNGYWLTACVAYK